MEKMVSANNLKTILELQKAYKNLWFFLKWFFPKKLAAALNSFDGSKLSAISVIEAFFQKIRFFQFYLFPFLKDFSKSNLIQPLLNTNNQSLLNPHDLENIVGNDYVQLITKLIHAMKLFPDVCQQFDFKKFNHISELNLNCIYEVLLAAHKNGKSLTSEQLEKLTKVNFEKFSDFSPFQIHMFFDKHASHLTPAEIIDFINLENYELIFKQMNINDAPYNQLTHSLIFTRVYMYALLNHISLDAIPSFIENHPGKQANLNLSTKLLALVAFLHQQKWLNADRFHTICHVFDDNKRTIVLNMFQGLVDRHIHISNEAFNLLFQHEFTNFNKPYSPACLQMSFIKDQAGFDNLIQTMAINILRQSNHSTHPAQTIMNKAYYQLFAPNITKKKCLDTAATPAINKH